MLIADFIPGAGITESPDYPISKGIGNLLFSSTLAPSALTTENLSIWIEKDGKNIILASDVLLKDYISLCSYGTDAIISNPTFATIANIDLTADGGYILLKDNETIKFKLRGLIPTQRYVLNGIEEPLPSSNYNIVVRKTMFAEDVSRDFDVKGYDFACLTNHASLIEITLFFDNGASCRYTPFELQSIFQIADPFLTISNVGIVDDGFADRILFPMVGVLSMNVRKSAGTRIDMHFQSDMADYEKYEPTRQ